MRFSQLILEMEFSDSEAQERYENKEWELGPETPIEGLKAWALLYTLENQQNAKILTPEEEIELTQIKEKVREYDSSEEPTMSGEEYQKLTDRESELDDKISVYHLIPDGERYEMTVFKVDHPSLSDSEFLVGTEEETHDSAVEATENLIQDVGLKNAFSERFMRQFIDTDKVRDYFYDMYSDDVYNNPESYLDESQRLLSDSQEDEVRVNERKIKSLENQIINFQENFSDYEGIDEKIEQLRDIIISLQDEIEDIKDNPDGDFPDNVIDDKIQDLADDVADDPMSTLDEHGLDIENFVDVEELIEESIKWDGYGHIINSFDGSDDEIKVQDQYFHVMRID